MEYENLFENFKGSEHFWTKNKKYDFFLSQEKTLTEYLESKITRLLF